MPVPLKIEEFDPAAVTKFRALLLEWYDENQRVLPWRQQTLPGAVMGPKQPYHGADANNKAYAVWISEIMLQQTQVATVIEYYKRWMDKWPTVAALADASLEEVNEMWAGLGYYSRARRLHEGANKIMTALDGQLPTTSAKLIKELPGVGPYTGCAIGSIAFNEPTGVVDGNVIRILTRLRAIDAPVTEDATTKALWGLAHALVDPERPGDFNQAMMELGATVCRPKAPSCTGCPVKAHCLARGAAVAGGAEAPNIEDYPNKPTKCKQKLEAYNVVVCTTHDEVTQTEQLFICQRPKKGLLAGMWQFPNVITAQQAPSEPATAMSTKVAAAADPAVATPVGSEYQACIQAEPTPGRGSAALTATPTSPTTASAAVAASSTPAAAAAAESVAGVLRHLETVLEIPALALASTACRPVGAVEHVFSHLRHTYNVYTVALSGDLAAVARASASGRWVSHDEFQAAAVSTNMKKVLKRCQPKPDRKPTKSAPGSAAKRRKVDAAQAEGQQTMSRFFKPKPEPT